MGKGFKVIGAAYWALPGVWETWDGTNVFRGHEGLISDRI